MPDVWKPSPEKPGEGYPTAKEIFAIQAWPVEDPRGWLDAIKTAWWSEWWGWSEEDIPTMTTVYMSTGGWSGNEDLVIAMRENRALWAQLWHSSRRGGHYTFRLEK